MTREEFLACLAQASESMEAKKAELIAAADEEAEEADWEAQMQEDELARMVAKELGLTWEA